MPQKAQARCSKYRGCAKVALCPSCSSQAAACKRCGKKRCWDICGELDACACALRGSAPLVCSKRGKRACCTLEKARYVASRARAEHDARSSAAHAGVACGPDGLKGMADEAKAPLSQGRSVQAIWIARKGEFPVCERAFYNCMDKGVMGLASIGLPKKVRHAPREKKEGGGPKMGLAGRACADWPTLPGDLKLLTVQTDCVEGLRRNSKRILALRFARLLFQLSILLENKGQACAKAALDAAEACCEGAFADAFPVMPGDRGALARGLVSQAGPGDGAHTARLPGLA